MASRVTLRWNQGPVTKRIRAEAEKRLRTVGQEGVQHWQSMLSGPSPSRPGGPPGMRTGTLVRSIRGRVTWVGKDKLRLAISGSPIAVMLDKAKTVRRRRPHVEKATSFVASALKRWFGLR